MVASVSVERDVQHTLEESTQNPPVSAEEIQNETEKDAVPQKALKNPIHQDPVPWPRMETPWTRLHVDFAGP
ncbi:hypothetical protein ACTXT7_017532, partial [Hymenolepis weldensis]